VAWRKVTAAVAGPAGPAVAELLAFKAECEAAGDAAGTAAARSWLDMLAAAGYHPQVADLFAGFAQDERAVRAMRARRGLA
jgi:hypothetical protein